MVSVGSSLVIYKPAPRAIPQKVADSPAKGDNTCAPRAHTALISRINNPISEPALKRQLISDITESIDSRLLARDPKELRNLLRIGTLASVGVELLSNFSAQSWIPRMPSLWVLSLTGAIIFCKYVSSKSATIDILRAFSQASGQVDSQMGNHFQSIPEKVGITLNALNGAEDHSLGAESRRQMLEGAIKDLNEWRSTFCDNDDHRLSRALSA